MNRFICIHGYFYQPPRENPWLEIVEVEDGAYPYHDWNERITAECYAPNVTSRILDSDKRNGSSGSGCPEGGGSSSWSRITVSSRSGLTGLFFTGLSGRCPWPILPGITPPVAEGGGPALMRRLISLWDRGDDPRFTCCRKGYLRDRDPGPKRALIALLRGSSGELPAKRGELYAQFSKAAFYNGFGAVRARSAVISVQ